MKSILRIVVFFICVSTIANAKSQLPISTTWALEQMAEIMRGKDAGDLRVNFVGIHSSGRLCDLVITPKYSDNYLFDFVVYNPGFKVSGMFGTHMESYTVKRFHQVNVFDDDKFNPKLSISDKDENEISLELKLNRLGDLIDGNFQVPDWGSCRIQERILNATKSGHLLEPYVE